MRRASSDSETVAPLVDAGLARTTALHYAYRWRVFTAWCAAHDRDPLPATPATIALYVTDCAQRGDARGSVATAICAVSAVHRALGHADPKATRSFANFQKGYKRSTTYRTRPFVPTSSAAVVALARSLPPSPRGLRDRAIILLAFAGALRRSELVELDMDQIHFGEGLRLNLTHRLCFIGPGTHRDTCPIEALRRWLRVSKIEKGRVFRATSRTRVLAAPLGPSQYHYVTPRCLRAAGFPKGLSFESLRRGCIQTLRLNGMAAVDIAKFVGRDPAHIERTHLRGLPINPEEPLDLDMLRATRTRGRVAGSDNPFARR